MGGGGLNCWRLLPLGGGTAWLEVEGSVTVGGSATLEMEVSVTVRGPTWLEGEGSVTVGGSFEG